MDNKYYPISTPRAPSLGDALRSHFCLRLVGPAYLNYRREPPPPEEWLLIDWPKAERDPTKYLLLTLSPNCPALTPLCAMKS
jgi:hypothetical protein